MLFKVLKQIKESKGLDDEMKGKIDVFYALGRLTKEQYEELIGEPSDELTY